MYIVRILQRKDAASLVLGVVLALAIAQALSQISHPLALKFVDEGTALSPVESWKVTYLLPALVLFFQVVLIEVLGRLFVLVRGNLVRKK